MLRVSKPPRVQLSSQAQWDPLVRTPPSLPEAGGLSQLTAVSVPQVSHSQNCSPTYSSVLGLSPTGYTLISGSFGLKRLGAGFRFPGQRLESGRSSENTES